MSVWKHWLEPSRDLPLLFLVIAVLLAGTLLWLGWQLSARDEELAQQHLQERRESAADIAAAAFQSALSQAQERLTDLTSRSWPAMLTEARALAASLPPDSVVILWQAQRMEAYPEGRLPFYPVTPARPGPPDSLFAEADQLEFRQANYPEALSVLGEIARSSDSAVRAAALLRVARIQRKQGRWEVALATYQEMSRLGETTIEGLPAELVIRQARLSVLDHLERHKERRDEAVALLRKLRQNPWRLKRGVYEFYLEEALRVLGPGADTPGDARALAESAASLYEGLSAEPDGAGRRLLHEKGLTTLALWRSTGDATAALLLGPAWFDSQWSEGLKASFARQGVRIGLTDPEGRPVLDSGGSDPALQTVRLASTTGLPFNLHAITTDADAVLATSSMRRRLVFGAFAVVTLLIVAGSLVVGRAVRRELVLSRMQSDFVSAVSHEFRTPLTSVCLLTEQLAAGRITEDKDRREYYSVLARESQRLRRLVEGLLNFGRMEAGAVEYRFETIDPAELLQGVVREFQNDVAESGYRVEVHANGDTPLVRADRAALSSAVWNLLDNAVKYSPESKTVWAEVAREDGSAAIRVRDRGLGIPADEQRAVFEKFRRGDAARKSGVCGTGVGLAMVQRIVAAHGGEIRLESELGRGSAFTMLLPGVG